MSQENQNRETRSITVSRGVHRRLRVAAAERELRLIDLADQLLTDGLEAAEQEERCSSQKKARPNRTSPPEATA